MKRRGFVLIIVLGLLGVMAYLALNFLGKSQVARDLAMTNMANSKCYLLSRSGIEKGNAMIGQRLESTTHPLHEPFDLRSHFSLGVSIAGRDGCAIKVKDTSGCINLNDGIKAGLLELGDLYQASWVDPWGGLPLQQTSGWLNYRIRKLLNSYGEVHHFLATLGKPVWSKQQFNSGITGSFGAPVSFISAQGARGVSEPSGEGLGDKILALRTTRGFRSLEVVNDAIDTWGTIHLSTANPSYLGGSSFSDFISYDLTLNSFIDDNFFRMTREFGTFENGGGHLVDMKPVDSNPPDLTPATLWQRHPVALVNLNTASMPVRAAMFYAPTQVSYVCEGLHLSKYVMSPAFPTVRLDTTQVSRPTLGVGGPVFNSLFDNGSNATCQSDHLMGLRDALTTSMAYEEAVLTYGAPWPDGFKAFQRHLSAISYDSGRPYAKVRYERAANGHGTPLTVNYSMRFTQDYVERTLPMILGCLRRLPGYLFAPSALISPYNQSVDYSRLYSHATPSLGFSSRFAHRSIEDFVYRSHMPKACFVPGGNFLIHSDAKIIENNGTIRRTIRQESQVFHTRIMRTQKEFIEATHASSDADIHIGPEPVSTLPGASYLGVVGLKDRVDRLPGVRNYSLAMDFDGSFDEAALGVNNLEPEDDSDPFMSPAGVIVENVAASGTTYPTSSAMPFNAAQLSTLRTAAVPPGTTWRVPKDALAYLNERFIAVSMAGFPKDEAGMKNFLFTSGMWGFLAGGRPFPGMGASMDEFAWLMIDSAAPLLQTSWVGPNGWLSEWKYGPPRTTPGTNYFAGATLEGASTSLFSFGANGSGGSDLSPFGGVQFSSRGHGSFANGQRFNDSLWFRPYRLLNVNAPGQSATRPTGEVFNKGTVSLWYRLPSGYQINDDPKVLLHITLWEKTQILNGNLATSPVEWRFVPTHITAYLKRNANDLEHIHAYVDNGQEGEYKRLGAASNMAPQYFWSYDAMLPGVAAPSSFATFPTNGMSVSPVSYWDSANEYYKAFQADEYSVIPPYHERGTVTRLDGAHFTPNGTCPGSWLRCEYSWDLSSPSTQPNAYYRPQVISSFLSSYKSYSTNQHEYVNSQADFNGQMCISIGEYPFYCVEHNAIDPHVHTSTAPYTPVQTPVYLTPGQFYPIRRFNSLIDNIDISFGEVKTGNMDAARYDVSDSREPRWVLQTTIPKNATLLSVGSRVFDVPLTWDANNTTHPTGSFGRHTAPWVLMGVEQALPSKTTYISDPWGPNDPIFLSPFRSPDERFFSGTKVGNDFKIILTYKGRKPAFRGYPPVPMADGPYLEPRSHNIPYIMEVSYRYIDGSPKILSWEVR